MRLSSRTEQYSSVGRRGSGRYFGWTIIGVQLWSDLVRGLDRERELTQEILYTIVLCKPVLHSLVMVVSIVENGVLHWH